MSVPEPEAPRKPRRLGLWIPFALLLVGVVALSGGWLFLRSQAEAQIDGAVAALEKGGYEIDWKERRITGFPFRLNVTLIEPRVREPGGWGLDAPRLEAQAFLHALGHWVIAAPGGATFTRPLKGPVAVSGKLIRASLKDLGKTPPSFSFEGTELLFTAPPGAEPLGLTAAKRVEFHLRAGPDDKGLVVFRVDEGKAQLSGLFARIAGDRPVSMIWESELSTMSAFKGSDWPEAVRAWSAGGGRITVRRAGITAGEALLGAQGGPLTVGYDGRLQGSLDVNLRQAPQALSALGQTGMISPEAALAAAAVAAARSGGTDAAQATITFQAGQTTLGPVAIAAAPRIY